MSTGITRDVLPRVGDPPILERTISASNWLWERESPTDNRPRHSVGLPSSRRRENSQTATQGRIAILRVLRYSIYSNMFKVPLHRKEEEDPFICVVRRVRDTSIVHPDLTFRRLHKEREDSNPIVDFASYHTSPSKQGNLSSTHPVLSSFDSSCRLFTRGRRPWS